MTNPLYSATNPHPHDAHKVRYVSDIYSHSLGNSQAAYRVVLDKNSVVRNVDGTTFSSILTEAELEELVETGDMWRVNP